jgi:hypothetical protein
VNRDGAALVLALLVLLVLEAVVLGTLYLTVQERRIAHNGVTALRLRLAAESAARAAAATLPAALDSLVAGAISRETIATGDGGLVLRTVYQRVDTVLVLAFAEAAEPPPRAGRARAALLVEPPLLPLQRIPDAALTAGAAVRLRDRASLAATSEPACEHDTERSADALRLPALHLLQRDAGALVDGTTAMIPLTSDWAALIARIAATLRSARVDTSYHDTTDASGVIAVDGDLTLPANAAVRGVLLVSGSLLIEPGAVVDGIVLATGPIDVHGTIRFSSCAARAAIRAAGLHRPRTYSMRTSIAAF